MKRIDKLIQKAISSRGIIADTNEDGFIEALGLLPDAYKRELPTGSVSYDAIRALSDTALTDWETGDDTGEF